LAIVAINLVVNGLVLGMSFVARAEVGLLMLIAVTLQTLFLSLIAAADVARSERAPGQIILLTVSLALMLPIGSLLALPVAVMRSPLQEGFLAFGFIALLYLIAEQVFANARDVPDKPWVAAMFFVGFLALLIVEEALG
jgi:ZIP family zinc transporter